MTTDSPCTLGSVTTRRSTWRPSSVSPTRPSCGTRRSAMSRSAMILMRETTPATIAPRHGHRPRSARRRCGSGRASRASSGSKWMSEAPCSAAWAMIWLHELDDRRVVGGLAQVDDLGRPPLVVLGSIRPSADDVVERAQAARRAPRCPRAMATAGADLVAGHHRDVVDRQHVRRVGHRDEQAALADEGDRDRLVALGGRRRIRLAARHVDLEDGEVEVVEAVTLGEGRARLSWVIAPCSSSTLLGRVPAARAASTAARPCAVDEAELDDDVGQEAAAPRGGAAAVVTPSHPSRSSGGG